MTSKKIFSLARQFSLKWANDKKTILPPPMDSTPTLIDFPAFDEEPMTERDPGMEDRIKEENLDDLWEEEKFLAPTMFPEEEDVYEQDTTRTLVPPKQVEAVAKKLLAKYSKR